MKATRPAATGLGLLALLIWATSNALTRDLSATIGPFTLLGLGFGGGGLVLTAAQALHRRSLTAPFRQPRRVLLGCGSCLALYLGCYVWGLALAPDDGAALVLGLVNYLWPSCILLLTPWFLRGRVRWPWLLGGVLLGPAGIVVAAWPDGAGWARGDGAGLQEYPGALLLMLVAAVSWALYTHLTRRWARPSSTPLPVLALGVGLLAGALGRLLDEPCRLEVATLPALSWFALAVCGVSYTCWDLAVGRGNVVLLALASNFTPVAATLVAGWYLGQPLTWHLLAGSVLIGAAAALGARGFAETRPADPARPAGAS